MPLAGRSLERAEVLVVPSRDALEVRVVPRDDLDFTTLARFGCGPSDDEEAYSASPLSASAEASEDLESSSSRVAKSIAVVNCL